jgi:hypothetical protein
MSGLDPGQHFITLDSAGSAVQGETVAGYLAGAEFDRVSYPDRLSPAFYRPGVALSTAPLHDAVEGFEIRPNCAGAAPKSRTLKVTRVSARSFTAASSTISSPATGGCRRSAGVRRFSGGALGS